MKQLFVLLARRWKSSTPKLFKRIAIGAAVVGVAALTLPSLPITLPTAVSALLPLISSACGGITSVALLTTTDEKLIKESGN